MTITILTPGAIESSRSMCRFSKEMSRLLKCARYTNAQRYKNSTFTDIVEISSDITQKKYTSVGEAMRNAVDAPIIKKKAKKWMKSLGKVAEKVPGLEFDKDYNAPHCIKGRDTFWDKWFRSGERPHDHIRATYFCKDIENFDILQAMIDELEKEGYKLGDLTKDSFDIRLGLSKSREELNKLDKKYHKYVSSPAKSGYEDIQLRFVDKDETEHELIILRGKNTADAKHDESEFVYNIVRALNKKDNGIVANSVHIAKQKERIGTILRTYISEPLFKNAKKQDVGTNEDLDIIGLFKLPIALLKNSLDELKVGIRKYWHVTENSKNLKNYNADMERIEVLSDQLNATIEKYSIE